MKLSLSVAIRFLKSNLSQTLIIILGIGVGISVQIFIGSLIQGLQRSLVEKTIGGSSQITITSNSDDKLIEDYKNISDKAVKSDSRIKEILAVYDNSALMEYNNKTQSLLIRGFELENFDKIYKISDAIIDGNMPVNPNDIILGKSLKDEYGLTTGQTINIITPDKRTVECRISGFFDLKVAQINSSWCITNLSNAQEIFKAEDVVTSLEMQVNDDDVFLSTEIADKIKSAINDDNFNVTDWQVQNEQLLSGLQGQSISSLMIQVFVMLSVVLGISSVLAITVMQKSKQIGIMKAMGIKNLNSSLIFLFEGLILGVLGAIVGILFGLGLSVAFTTFALNADGTPVVSLYINAKFIALSGAIAICACLIASLIPARKSSVLNPIDIIRNN